MTLKSALASFELHRRVPFISDLYERIDVTHAETEATRAERDAARAERDAARAESEAAHVKLLAIEEASAKERFVLLKRMDWMLLLDRTSLIDKLAIANYVWEEAQVKKLFSFIDTLREFPGKRYFVDCGAYWGLYSLIAYKTQWFNHIIAFEPDALNRSQLHAQLAVNLLAYEIEVRGVALSDTAGLKAFWKSSWHPDGNRAGVGMASEAGDNAVLVTTDKLDNQLPVEDALLFIKVDVEGGEVRVLAGAETVLTKNQVVLQVESMADDHPDRVRKFLARLGYRELGIIENDIYFSNAPRALVE